MTTGPTEAERLRRCRLLFEQALAAGTTPAELARRQAVARWSSIEGRLAARRTRGGEAEAPSQPWMMRD